MINVFVENLKIWKIHNCNRLYSAIFYSPFCVPAKVTKLIGLKRPPFLSPTNLIIFACTQNGEYQNCDLKFCNVYYLFAFGGLSDEQSNSSY